MWGSGPYNSARPRPPSRISKYMVSLVFLHIILQQLLDFSSSPFSLAILSLSLSFHQINSITIYKNIHTHTQTPKRTGWIFSLRLVVQLDADWIGSIHNTKADRQELLDRFRSGKRIQIRRGKFVCSRGDGRHSDDDDAEEKKVRKEISQTMQIFQSLLLYFFSNFRFLIFFFFFFP